MAQDQSTTILSLVERLSQRQIDVLQLIVRGLTNHEIAVLLGISSETVRTHVSAIISRLQVSNRTEAATAYCGWEMSVQQVRRFPVRPAIAVLPVRTINAAALFDGYSVGLTQEIVGLFSRSCWFPVIASPFEEDQRASRACAKRLGAPLLFDSALRKAGAAWHLVAHVEETESGRHLWSERYDCSRDDLFAGQVHVCHKLVAACYERLIDWVRARYSLHHGEHMSEPWDVTYRALVTYFRRERDANLQAELDLKKAILREPMLVLAHYGIGLVALDQILFDWSPRESAMDLLAHSAENCRALAPQMAEGYYLDACRWHACDRRSLAVSLLETAIRHNPSFGPAHSLLGHLRSHVDSCNEESYPMRPAYQLSPPTQCIVLPASRVGTADEG